MTIATLEKKLKPLARVGSGAAGNAATRIETGRAYRNPALV